jgi:hypothetical protein
MYLRLPLRHRVVAMDLKKLGFVLSKRDLVDWHTRLNELLENKTE